MKSAKAWRDQPLLPLLSVSIGVAVTLPAVVSRMEPSGTAVYSLIGLVLLALTAGYAGTERVWYSRVWEDEVLTARQVIMTAMGFFSRYVRLGLLIGLLGSIVVVIPVTAVIAASRGTSSAGWAVFMGVVIALVVDITMTFVTPALAFTTADVRRGLAIGFGVLRDTWPRNAGYVLTPALVLLLVSRLDPVSDVMVALVMSVVATLVNLLLKGATASFYLRSIGAD